MATLVRRERLPFGLRGEAIANPAVTK